MARYDGLRKTARDQRIYKYVKRHPELAQQEIADKYGLARSNIARIIKQQRRQEEGR